MDVPARGYANGLSLPENPTLEEADRFSTLLFQKVCSMDSTAKLVWRRYTVLKNVI